MVKSILKADDFVTFLGVIQFHCCCCPTTTSASISISLRFKDCANLTRLYMGTHIYTYFKLTINVRSIRIMKWLYVTCVWLSIDVFLISLHILDTFVVTGNWDKIVYIIFVFLTFEYLPFGSSELTSYTFTYTWMQTT